MRRHVLVAANRLAVHGHALAAALLLGGRVLADAADLPPGPVLATNAHTDHLNSVAFSVTSDRLASGSSDYSAKVWSVAGFSLVTAVYNPSQEFVTAVTLSPDGTLLSTGTDVGRVWMWHLPEGDFFWRGGPTTQVTHSQHFSPDNTYVAIGRSSPYLNLVEANGGWNGRVFEGHVGDVFTARYSRTGDLLASGGADQTAKIWRISDGALLHDLRGAYDGVGHSGSVYSVDFSPDGQMLLTTSRDGTSRLWKVSDGGLIRVIDGAGGAFSRFLADGRFFMVSTGNGTLDFYDGGGAVNLFRVSDGALMVSYPNLRAGPLDVSRDGKYFAYGRIDGVLVLARMPLVITDVLRSGNETVLKWQGGSGRYQLQSCADLSSANWQNIGSVTTNTVATNAVSAPVFYRVQSLPNP